MKLIIREIFFNNQFLHKQRLLTIKRLINKKLFMFIILRHIEIHFCQKFKKCITNIIVNENIIYE